MKEKIYVSLVSKLAFTKSLSMRKLLLGSVCTHTHTHTHTHIHTLTHSHTHTLIHSPTHTRTHTHPPPALPPPPHTHTHAHAHTQARVLTHTDRWWIRGVKNDTVSPSHTLAWHVNQGSLIGLKNTYLKSQ